MSYCGIKDKEFKKIIKDIMRNREFKKMYTIEHHGISRMEHLLKISYISYKLAKFFKLDYKSVARGALLHDFYPDGDERTKKRKFLDTFSHPKKALNTSKNIFEINLIEQNIIYSHMFPIYPAIPKFKESIIVNLVDKIIGFNELKKEYIHKCIYLVNYSCLFIILLSMQTKLSIIFNLNFIIENKIL